MLEIKSNGIIRMSRGDSAYLTVSAQDSTGTPYFVQDTDEVSFAIYENKEDMTPIVDKRVIGSAQVELLPEDTANLNLGDYFYKAKILSPDGTVHSVTWMNTFTLEG